MSNNLKERLKQKGWTDDDIYKAVSIIERGKTKKSKKILLLDSIIYWVVLLVALLGNFIISIILIPFMLAMQGIKLYFIVAIIGFAFGAFFDLLIRDLENITNKDILIAGIFLPALAIINVVLMVKFANFLGKGLLIANVHQDPIPISIVYAIAFILPYAIKSLVLIKEGRKDIIHKL